MLRNLSFIGAFVFILGLASSAPGGPGDSDPIVPTPHVIVHAPAKVLQVEPYGKIDVWVHDHHMDCGIWSARRVSVTGTESGEHTVEVLDVEITDRGDGSWDEQWTLDTTGWDLVVGETLTFSAETMNVCEGKVTYEGFAEALVVDGE
jgi:hypothetical protein